MSRAPGRWGRWRCRCCVRSAAGAGGAASAAPLGCIRFPVLPPGPARLRSARRCDWAEDGAGRMEILMTVSKIASICTMVSEGPGRSSPALPAPRGWGRGAVEGAVGRRARGGLRGRPGLRSGRRWVVRRRPGLGSAAVGGVREPSGVNRLWETQP